MAQTIAELRKEFVTSISETKPFFKLVDRRGAGYVDARSRPSIPDEQFAWQDDIRRRLCCLLLRLATPLQQSPLLDAQDPQRFVVLGRAMDAALDLKSYRRFGLKSSRDTRRAPIRGNRR
jgi:hypothetical protein